MVHVDFIVQVVCLEWSLVVLCALFAIEMATYRLVPCGSQSTEVRRRMAWFGCAGCVLQTARCIDSAAAFGLIPGTVQNLLASQVTSLLVWSMVLGLSASVQSSYLIIGRPTPRGVLLLMYGTSVASQLGMFGIDLACVLLLPQWEVGRLGLATNLIDARLVVFNAMTVIMFALAWFALYGLRHHVLDFARTIEVRERESTKRNDRLSYHTDTGGSTEAEDGSDLRLHTQTLHPPPTLPPARSTAPSPTALFSPTLSDANTPSPSPTPIPEPTHSPQQAHRHLLAHPSSVLIVTPLSARLSELRLTARRLLVLHMVISLILVVGFVTNVPDLIDWARGEHISRIAPDPNKSIPLVTPIYPVFQNVGLYLALWYGWYPIHKLRVACRDRTLLWQLWHGASSGRHSIHKPQQATSALCPPSPLQPPAATGAALDTPLMSQLPQASAPLDSAASHAPTGLSMRSGFTSMQAIRAEGDLYLDADVDVENPILDRTHLRHLYGRHPFAIDEQDEQDEAQFDAEVDRACEQRDTIAPCDGAIATLN